MSMDMCVKRDFPFSGFTGILFPRGNELHYIGGAEVLPAPLTPQEESEKLEEMLKDSSQEAKSCLIEHNLRLVVYIAKKFDNTGVGVEDLISIGTIGLIKAINTFNPVKKIKLATYASRCIENEILMYLRRNSKTRMEVSIDEPLNVDWDGNELLLSDILGTDEDVIYRILKAKWSASFWERRSGSCLRESRPLCGCALASICRTGRRRPRRKWQIFWGFLSRISPGWRSGS